MFNEPRDEFFYSSYKVNAKFSDDLGTVKDATATAFIIDAQNGIPLIVTNRHVIDIDYRQRTAKYKNFRLAALSISGRTSDDSVYSLRLHEDAKMYFHEDNQNDVVLIEARIYFDKGDEKLHWHFGLEQLAGEEEYRCIKPFDLVCYTGFPDQHDKLGNRPILRSGRIASDPKFDYSWDNQPKGKCVAYEGFSSSGASGSPVFAPSRGLRGGIADSRHGYLIGVNAGHIPGTEGHTGISYFYKSTVILDILKINNLLAKKNG